jgi:hypothetical protein
MAVAVSATDNAHHWGPALAVVSMALAHVLCYALNPHSWLFRRVLSRLRVPRLLFITNRCVGVGVCVCCGAAIGVVRATGRRGSLVWQQAHALAARAAARAARARVSCHASLAADAAAACVCSSS